MALLSQGRDPRPTRTQRPILLAVDQQLGEGAALRVAPELSDPVGPLEVGEHQDVEQLGAASRAKGVQACSQSSLELIGLHGLETSRSPNAPVRGGVAKPKWQPDNAGT